MKLTKIIDEEYTDVQSCNNSELKNEKTVEELISAYQRWEINFKKMKDSEIINWATSLVKLGVQELKDIRYDSSDITACTVSLGAFDGEEIFIAGYFISAMVYNHQEEYIKKHQEAHSEYREADRKKYQEKNEERNKYLLITEHFQTPLLGLGAFNKSDILIQGDAGDFLGIYMHSGIIRVSGKARDDIGTNMTGGRIEIIGSYKSIGQNCKGEGIYSRGKKVYPKKIKRIIK